MSGNPVSGKAMARKRAEALYKKNNRKEERGGEGGGEVAMKNEHCCGWMPCQRQRIDESKK
jgi:hypothetical protein